MIKTRIAAVAVALSFAAAAACFAANPHMGTWKLNEAKSKIPDGMPKNTTVIYAQSGDEVTITVEGVDHGKAVHHVWMGKMDGKDYAAKGSDMHDTRAYTKVDANTLTYTVKKGGKDVGTGKVVLAADGKTRTVKQGDFYVVN